MRLYAHAPLTQQRKRVGFKKEKESLAAANLNITSTEEAEEFSNEWLKSKYRDKLAKRRFNQVMLESGIWQLKAESELRTGLSKDRAEVILNERRGQHR